MGFFDNLKKKMALKETTVPKKTQNTLEKINILENTLEKTPPSFNLLFKLYGYYIDVSNTSKKIECLEKMVKLNPHDAYPLEQLARVFDVELHDTSKAKYYQQQANKINSNKFM
ncbi:MAG: hypothetical protein HOK63_07830 [Thaumarchaeota archaeon]|jgi:tetratricopeptide (TPR) repeat protein|nr:hypothetical protein [Nitrososphaerota archaeon]MBT5842911.1 hypothetical protein [Nitrososphaerota archaeon]MBT6469528.1 hypothetical protein [Nitrososphaerota archaeon]